MLKVKPPDSYPPEEGHYLRGNDFSPVAVCVILDTFDFAIPEELNKLVMAGLDTGAALSGMLQTENVGIEKIIRNIVANPNIRYIVLCGRETGGHLAGESLLSLKEHSVDGKNQIIGTAAPTPHLFNIPPNLREIQKTNSCHHQSTVQTWREGYEYARTEPERSGEGCLDLLPRKSNRI